MNALLHRLAQQERELSQRLAEREELIQKFEKTDRPAYEVWVRLELGPRISILEEILGQIREKRILVHRVEALIERQGLHPREALYVATFRTLVPTDPDLESNDDADEAPDLSETSYSGPSEADAPRSQGYSPEEVEARRRAKLESKRATRKEAKKNAKRNLNPLFEESSSRSSSHSPDSNAPIPDSPAEIQRRKGVKLYRRLAWKLHPDSIDAIPAARAQKLWLEVQAAYDALDWNRLLSIAAWLGEGVSGTLDRSLSERYDRIRSLNRSSIQLDKRVGGFRLHPAWGFSTSRGSDRKKLKKQAAREMEDQMAEAQRALEAIEDFIESLGPPRPLSASQRARSRPRK